MTKKCRETDAISNSNMIERRAFLENTGRLLVAAGIAAGGVQRAHAMQKAEQSSVSYQDTPKDGVKCADCRFYDGEGGCTVVEGEISPDGWCAVWVEA